MVPWKRCSHCQKKGLGRAGKHTFRSALPDVPSSFGLLAFFSVFPFYDNTRHTDADALSVAPSGPPISWPPGFPPFSFSPSFPRKLRCPSVPSHWPCRLPHLLHLLHLVCTSACWFPRYCKMRLSCSSFQILISRVLQYRPFVTSRTRSACSSISCFVLLPIRS